MKKNKIILYLSLVILLIIAVVYLYNYNRPSERQALIRDGVVMIPNESGQIAKLSSLEGANLKGYIRDSNTGKKTEGKVVAYLDQMLRFTGNTSFIIPFELDYGKQDKHLYLGVFYFEFDDDSVLNNANSPKTLKHGHSYLLGKNISLKSINSLIIGSYSHLIDLEYLNKEKEKKEVLLRFFYSENSFEVAKKCEEVGSIHQRGLDNGETYEVCVFDNGNECTLEAYENENCPVDGYDISIVNSQIEKWGVSQGFLYRDGKFIFPANLEDCTIDDFYFNRCEV